jgi:hypothetical protein
MKKYYKITGPKGEPLYRGSGNWALPVGDRPGKWMPKIENVKACMSGYHLVEAVGIVEWLPRAPKTGLLWEAEGRGDSDKEDTKTAFAQARLIKLVGVLDEVSMRLAAADMAKRVLPIFHKVRPHDNRPALAIQAARDFALGKINYAARTAAGAAAWAAARATTAGAAAGDAATAAGDAATAAGDAAGDGAGDAATAAWAAARATTAGAASAKIIMAQARKRKLALSE